MQDGREGMNGDGGTYALCCLVLLCAAHLELDVLDAFLDSHGGGGWMRTTVDWWMAGVRGSGDWDVMRRTEYTIMRGRHSVQTMIRSRKGRGDPNGEGGRCGMEAIKDGYRGN